MELVGGGGGQGGPHVSFADFVARELIHFSLYDVQRSIPSAIDGLKISQRKALFGCFERNLVKDEVRVAQLAAYVAERACFHHGEASMQGTIVGLAQEFVGSNNVALLEPIGQYGTRLCGGSDVASARYIHTRLAPLARALFPKADDAILEYETDDGTAVQPKHYLPILPLVLINGATGIGTGYSTSVPCFHPLDLAAAVRGVLRPDAHAPPVMRPWYRGFRGEIRPRSAAAGAPLVSHGVVRRGQGAAQARILEAPLGYWTEDLKEAVEALIERHPAEVKGYANASFDTTVDLTITFASKDVADAWLAPLQAPEGGGSSAIRYDCRLAAELKLASAKGLGMTNMHLFDEAGRIRRYESPEAVLRAFVPVRLAGYEARKAAQVAELRREIQVLANRTRFLGEVVSGDLQLQRAEGDVELDALLAERGYDPDVPSASASTSASASAPTHRYLTGMAMHSLTRARKAALDTELTGKRARLEELLATSAVALWEADLAAFEQAYRERYGADDRGAAAAGLARALASAPPLLPVPASTGKARAKAGGGAEGSKSSSKPTAVKKPRV